jgi:hypothetical protein
MKSRNAARCAGQDIARQQIKILEPNGKVALDGSDSC